MRIALALLMTLAALACGCGPSRETRIEQARSEAAIRREQSEEAEADRSARKREAAKEGERMAEEARAADKKETPCKPFESLPEAEQEKLLQFSASNGNWFTNVCCPIPGTQPRAAKACPDKRPMLGE